jgi:predicted short-subunit dehydrogenase-like oxidoreductase (DUF2520 family)
MNAPKVAIIGSGNIASHLLPELKKSGAVSIMCLHNRNPERGLAMCKENKIAYANSYASIPTDVEIVFVMTSDEAIPSVTQSLSKVLRRETIIVHFSGSAELSSIDPYFNQTASSWPIQSISRNDQNLDFSQIPFCISSQKAPLRERLGSIFGRISSKVVQVDEEEKRILHLAAVVANNFTNHLLVKSKELLENHHLDFDLLAPIIKKTTENALTYDPRLIQTGPAARNDLSTMKSHLEILQNNPTLEEIYRLISKSIKSTQDEDSRIH